MTEDAAGQRGLARRLLAAEAEGASGLLEGSEALDRVCRKLHHRLAPVVGEFGVRLTMVRAVKVTRARFPFIAADPVPGEGDYLKGLRQSLQGQDSAMASEAVTSLLANLLALLVSLLGKNLISVLLREAWPELEIP